MKENIPSQGNKFETFECDQCKLKIDITSCNHCGTKGVKNCADHWNCPHGGLLAYAENLPWFSTNSQGYFCINCGMPPR